MAAKIVGTAYVRIRALTDKLSDDIKKGVDKGLKDSDAEKLGEEAGKETGASFAKGFDEKAFEDYQASIEDALDSGNDPAYEKGRETGVSFHEGFDEEVEVGIPDAVERAVDNEENDESASRGGESTGRKWTSFFRDRINVDLRGTFRNLFRRNPEVDRDSGVGGQRSGTFFGDGFLTTARSKLVDLFNGDGQAGILAAIREGLQRGLKNALTSAFASAGPDGEKSAASTGLKTARSFISAFGSAATKGLAALVLNPVVLIGSAIAALTPLIVNVLVGLVAQIGTVFDAALGGIAALGAGIGAGLLSIIPVIAAFTVETDQLEFFKEEIGLLGEEFKGVAEIVQDLLFPAILDLVDFIASSDYLPLLELFAEATGNTIADFIDALRNLLTFENTYERISSILGQSADVFRRFLQGMVPLVDLVITLFDASLPLAGQLADEINESIGNLNQLFGEKAFDGSLQKNFQELYDTFILVGGGLIDISAAIINIATIGGRVSGISFFENFRDFAERARNFTKSPEGIAKIEEIFLRAEPVLRSFNELVRDLFVALFNSATSEGAANSTVAFLDWLRLTALPFLTDVLGPGIKGAFDVVGTTFTNTVLPALEGFAEVFMEIFGPAFQEAFGYIETRATGTLDTFADAFQRLKDPAKSIAESLADVIIAFVPVAAALNALVLSKVLEILVEGFVFLAEALAFLLEVPGVAEFIGIVLAVVSALGTLVAIGSTIAGFVSTIGGAFTLVGGAVSSFVALFNVAFTTILPTLGLVAGALGISVGAFLAIAAGIAVLGVVVVKYWDQISEFFVGIFNWITDLDNLKSIPGLIADGIGAGFDFLLEALGDALAAIPDILATVGEFLLDGFKAGFDFLVKYFPKAASAVGRALLSGLKAALKAVARSIPGLLGLLLDVFLTLLIDLPIALASLNIKLIELFAQALGAVASWLKDTGIPLLIEFWVTLPERIVTAVLGLGQLLFDGFSAGINFLIDKLPDLLELVIQFFKDLPGNIVSGIGNLATFLAPIFVDALEVVKEKVGERLDTIVEFFTGLPGRLLGIVEDLLGAGVDLGQAIIDGIGDGLSGALDSVTGIAQALEDAFKNAWNNVVGFINSAWNEIEVDLPGPFGKVGLPDDIPNKYLTLAQGGIFDKATFAQIGEDGREAVLPLTDPVRTYQLAVASNLFDVLQRGAELSGNSSVFSSSTTTSNVFRSPLQLQRSGTAAGGAQGRAGVVFESGAIPVYAQGAPAWEVADQVVSKLDWKLTNRSDS